MKFSTWASSKKQVLEIRIEQMQVYDGCLGANRKVRALSFCMIHLGIFSVINSSLPYGTVYRVEMTTVQAEE